jgi:hypothetical protein
VPRVPLLSGSRLTIVNAPDDATVLRPPAPDGSIADIAAAVRDALRFPLAGDPLEVLAPRGGRVTVVVEPPALPLPGIAQDPRRLAIAATMEELRQLGVRFGNQTLLVAGGLMRRPGQRALAELVPPEFGRRFDGHVEVHDVERSDLVDVAHLGELPLRVHPVLVESDLVVVVTAAETVAHGGAAALLAAGGPEALRAAESPSLVETAGSRAWQLATTLERALGRRVPVFGVSVALSQPHLGGAARGYPYDPEAAERIARSPLARLYRALPARARAHVLHSIPAETSITAAFAGPPSVAHAEALLRAVEERSAPLEAPLDAICIGVPRATPHLPRERPNPLLAAYLGLGLALRLWRDDFPLADGGTAILLHGFSRHFAHPTQQPYRAFFQATRNGPEPESIAAAEAAAATDDRAIESYRNGRSCHPLLPFADWAACTPAIERAGAVLVAGCRDSVAARQLGFVPTHGVNAALEMAHGRAGGPPRIGFLLSPPYFPLRVGTS